MKGLLPWLRELFHGPDTRCVWGSGVVHYCYSQRHPDCGSLHCADHCETFCHGRCKKPPPKLGIVLGMRR